MSVIKLQRHRRKTQTVNTYLLKIKLNFFATMEFIVWINFDLILNN